MSPGLQAAFGAALIIILATTAISYRNANTLFDESQWVAHTHEVRSELSGLLSGLQDAETGTRGFILTGDEAYLAPHAAVRQEVVGRLDHLRRLIADNPDQERRLRDLEPHITVLLGWLDGTVATQRRAGVEAARERVVEGTGKREMDAARAGIRSMEAAEDRLLGERARAARDAATTASGTFAVAAVLAGALIGVLYTLLGRHLRVQAEASREREELLAREQAARRAAEQGQRQVEEASRAKDSFLATVSHELRTPLSPILAWTDMLERGTLDAAQSRRALATIRRCARAQVRLVEDLLDVSRIVAGKMRLAVRPVELGGVIRAAVDVIRPAADAKNIRLQTVIDTETAAISGDAERLQQIVWNLLSNAVKFTPKGGRVTVVLERVNSHVEIAVSDTGQGIDPEFLPHVFERFRQDDVTSTRRYAGLGLGLAIVRHIVEAHGGTVHADSPGRGEGAVFTVKLPLILIPRTAGEAERRHPRELELPLPAYPSLDRVRVLVVDDEPDSNEVVRALLASCGAEVRVAASVDQATDILGRWTPDVLVSDIGMPGEDGYGLIAKVRARTDRAARIPAVALTAYASVDDRVRLLSAGFQMHVPKPVEPAELVAVVASAARGVGNADTT